MMAPWFWIHCHRSSSNEEEIAISPNLRAPHSVLDACITAEQVFQKLDSRRQLENRSDDRCVYRKRREAHPVCGPIIRYAFRNLAQLRGARRREPISKKHWTLSISALGSTSANREPDFRKIPLPSSSAMESVIQVAV